MASLGIVTWFMCGCSSEHPDAPDADDPFSAPRITYLVGSKPGGGYDLYARLVARYLEKHLPGSQVQVKNVPGAGSIVAYRRLAVAEPDGQTIGTFNSGLIYAQLLGHEAMEVDLATFSWIGKAATNQRVLVASRKSGFRSLKALAASREPVLFGASAVGSASHSEALMMRHVLGLNLKMVTGLAGNDTQLSMMRGEIEASFGSLSSYHGFVERGDGEILLRIGDGDTFTQIVADLGHRDQEDASAMFDLLDTVASLGRMTAAPPGLPARVLETLREAYAKALADPELIEEAARIGLPIDPLRGQEVAMQVSRVLAQPVGFREYLNTVVARDEEERQFLSF